MTELVGAEIEGVGDDNLVTQGVKCLAKNNDGCNKTHDIIMLPEDNLTEEKLSTHLMQQIQNLYKAHGDAHLQKLLQEEIAKVKKKTSEIATMKKKLTAETRKLTDANEEKRKFVALKSKSESVCRALQETLKKRKEVTAHFVEEMTKHRHDVAERIKNGLQETESKLDVRQAALDELSKENSTLQIELEAKKTAFDEACATFKNGLTNRVKAHEELLRNFGTSTKQIEMLEAKLLLIRRERDALERGRELLEKQFEIYDEKYKVFAPTLTNPDDVAHIAEQQRTQANARIAELEKEKTEAHDLRIKLEKEITELRSKQATLKKEIASAEKARSVAEKRCRQAQAETIAKKEAEVEQTKKYQ